MGMPRGQRILVWVALLTAAPGIGVAAPVAAFRSLSNVVSEADAIALAIVGSTRLTSDGPVVTLQVVDTLKGSLRGAVEAVYPKGHFGFPPESSGKTIIVFLAEARAGGERPIYRLTSGTPLAERAVFVPDTSPLVSLPGRGPGDSVFVKVIKEMARSAAASEDSEAWIYLLTMGRASDIEPGAPALLQEIFEAMSASSESWLASRGVDGLLHQGQIEGLRALENALLKSSDVLDGRGWAGELESYYRSESIEGTAILERMISLGRPVELRRAAGRALRRIHSFHMLPLLARMLDDPDIELRSSAVQGFSAFAAGFRITGPQRKEGEWPFLTVEAMTWAVHDDRLFREGEQEYLAYWRDWWPRNRALVAEIAEREEAPR